MHFFYTIAFFLLICASSNAEKLMIVAHRGGARNALENTIPAFKQAWKQGADAIEGDFQLTKDGYIVCIHDKNTKRVANKNLIIKESTLRELQQLHLGSSHGKKYKGVRIPTIAEVFAIIPKEKKIYIEIKCGVEIISKLINEINISTLKQEQVVIICFDKEVIRKLKSLAPQFKAFWLSGFSLKNGKIVPSLETVLKTLKEIHADGFSSSKNIINKSFIKSIKQYKYEYHVWTVDDVKTARRFRAWGAGSITTNIPGYIKGNLKK